MLYDFIKINVKVSSTIDILKSMAYCIRRRFSPPLSIRMIQLAFAAFFTINFLFYLAMSMSMSLQLNGDYLSLVNSNISRQMAPNVTDGRPTFMCKYTVNVIGI